MPDLRFLMELQDRFSNPMEKIISSINSAAAAAEKFQKTAGVNLSNAMRQAERQGRQLAQAQQFAGNAAVDAAESVNRESVRLEESADRVWENNSALTDMVSAAEQSADASDVMSEAAGQRVTVSQQLSDNVNLETLELKNASIAAKENNYALNSMSEAARKTADTSQRNADDQNKLASSSYNAAKNTDSLGESLDGLDTAAENYGSGMFKAADSLLQLIAAAGRYKVIGFIKDNFTSAAGAAVEFGSAITGVHKTVDSTHSRLDKLSETAKNMSLDIPSAVGKISYTTENAGHKSLETDSIKSFVKTVMRLRDVSKTSAGESVYASDRFADAANVSEYLHQTDSCALTNEKAVEVYGFSDRYNRERSDLVDLPDSQYNTIVTENSTAGAAAVWDPCMENVREFALAYDKAYGEIRNSLDGMFGLFEKVDVNFENTLSFESAVSNIESQIEYFNRYEEALSSLSKYGFDNNIISQLDAQQIINFSNELGKLDTETAAVKVNEINEAFGKLSDAKDKTAGTMTDIDIDVSQRLEALQLKIETAVDNMELDSKAAKAAESTMSSYAARLAASGNAAVTEAQKIADRISAALASVSVPSVAVSVPDVSVSRVSGAVYGPQRSPLNAYAAGTDSAAKGIALVGEKGPELVYFGGGEKVYTAARTENILNSISGNSNIKLHNIGGYDISNVISDYLYKTYNTGNANYYYDNDSRSDINNIVSEVLYQAYKFNDPRDYYGSSDISNFVSDSLYKAQNTGNASYYYNNDSRSDINNIVSEVFYQAYKFNDPGAYYGSSDISNVISDFLYKAYNTGNTGSYYDNGSSSYINNAVSDVLYRVYNAPYVIGSNVISKAYAAGTSSAAPGIALVGEEGPELVYFGGGERVYTAGQTKNILSTQSAANAGFFDMSRSFSAGMSHIESIENIENTMSAVNRYAENLDRYSQSVISQNVNNINAVQSNSVFSSLEKYIEIAKQNMQNVQVYIPRSIEEAFAAYKRYEMQSSIQNSTVNNSAVSAVPDMEIPDIKINMGSGSDIYKLFPSESYYTENLPEETEESDDPDVSKNIIDYMIQSAEREAVNKYANMEIKIEMNNNNNIGSEADIDQIMDAFTRKVTQAMETAAEGVHI